MRRVAWHSTTNAELGAADLLEVEEPLVSNTFSTDRNSPRHSNDDASPLPTRRAAKKNKRGRRRRWTRCSPATPSGGGALDRPRRRADAHAARRQAGRAPRRHRRPREAAADQHGGAAAERRRRRAEHVHGGAQRHREDAKTLAWLIACVSKRLHLFSTLSVAQQEAMVGRMFKENVAENEILIQLGDETAEYAAQFRAILRGPLTATLTAGTATSSPPAPSR